MPVANNPDDERRIDQQSKMLGSEPYLPAMHPLVVNDTVLMRTIEGLVAVDATTGRRIWPYPWSDPVMRQFQEASDDPFGAAGGISRGQELQQRIWKDAPYGQLSSDGRAVFLLDQLDTSGRYFFALSRDRLRIFSGNTEHIYFGLFALQLKTPQMFLSVTCRKF